MTSRMCRANSEKDKMRKFKAGKDSFCYSLWAGAQLRPGTTVCQTHCSRSEPVIQRNSDMGLVHVSVRTGMG